MKRFVNQSLLNPANFTLPIVSFAPYVFQLIMQITFARYLSVEHVSIYAAINIFLLIILGISNTLADKYIIVTKEISDESIDRIFTIELLFSIFIFTIVYLFLKDAFIDFIDIEYLGIFWLLAACLICFYNPLSRTKAILEKEKNFIFAFLPLFIAHIISACVAIYLLEKGFGVWAMIGWRFLIYFLEIIILFLFSSYRPKINLKVGFKDFLIFSYPIYFVSILSIFFTNLDYLILVTIVGEERLGIYWMAFSLSHIILSIRDIIQKILLPNLASQSSNLERNIFFIRFINQILFIMLFSLIFVTI